MSDTSEPRRLWIARAPDFEAEPLTERPGRHPRWSPDGKYIAFAGPRAEDEVETVWLIHADGSNLRDLLPGQAAIRATSTVKSVEGWLDERTIILADNCGAGCLKPAALDIYTRQVQDYPAQGRAFAWSPQGDAYASIAGGGIPQFSLWRRTEQNGWQETALPSPAEFHSWSPGGRAFTYSHWPWQPGAGAPYALTSRVPTLALWDVERGQGSDLVPGGYHGVWSPDGARIAFLFAGNPLYDAQGRISGTDLAPGRPFPLSLAILDVPSVQVIAVLPIQEGFDPAPYREVGLQAGFAARQPRWSPDGSRLVFWATGYDRQAWYDDHGGDMWLVDRDGGGRRRLTEGQGVTHVQWSPDGARLTLLDQGRLEVLADPALDADTTPAVQTILPLAPVTPAGCLIRGTNSLLYASSEDGYCLRYPTGFQVGRTPPHIAEFYGPPHTPGLDPAIAGLTVMVQELEPATTLDRAAERYVAEQQRVGRLSPQYTRTLTVLGGQPAVLLEGPGEYTALHIWLTVYQGKQYTLSIWPDASEYPIVAEDVHALWQTAPLSFSFLPNGYPELEPPPKDPSIAPSPTTTETLHTWEVPRLIAQRADDSLWASALDGGDPWPLTGPLTGETDAVLWSLSPETGPGRWLALVQSVGVRRGDTLSAGTLSLIDLATGKQEILLRSLLPPNDGWQRLPLTDGDRAVLWENAPAWSPDGARFAFLSAHEGQVGLYAYALESGGLARLASGVNAAWSRWSPGGTQIVYTAVDAFGTGAGPTTHGLWTVPADGSAEPRQLTAGGKQDQRLVAWLDATRIMIVSSNLMGERDLALIDVQSGARTSLVEGELAGYAWSEDAGLLAVSPGEENGALQPGVYLIDPDEPASALRISDQTVRRPRWSPRGRYLAYATDDGCALYDRQQGSARTVRREWCTGVWSSDERELAYVDTSLKLARVETGESEEVAGQIARHVRWSPDGAWLTWLRETQFGRFDLFALRPGAGRPFRVATDLPSQHWIEWAWVSSAPVDVATKLSATQTVDLALQVPADAARDEATQVLAFRDGLLFRTPLAGGDAVRVALDCRLIRHTPGVTLRATQGYYQSLRFSPDRRRLVIENGDHRPCLLDLRTLEGQSLPPDIRISWSPSGRQFAYVERARSAPEPGKPPIGTLYIHDVEQDARHALWKRAGLEDVLWSPDGARLVTWAHGDGVDGPFWVLDPQGTVLLSGTHRSSIFGPPLFWSTDGRRLAVLRENPVTRHHEWEVLNGQGEATGRVPYGEVFTGPEWMPDRERESRVAPSSSGAFVAQVISPGGCGDEDWWRCPSTVSIVDAESGETVRAWEIDSFVSSVRWSAGDGWLLLGVLHVLDRPCEYPEFGPCGVHGSVWRLPVNGTGEPERVLDDGFLVEAIP